MQAGKRREQGAGTRTLFASISAGADLTYSLRPQRATPSTRASISVHVELMVEARCGCSVEGEDSALGANSCRLFSSSLSVSPYSRDSALGVFILPVAAVHALLLLDLPADLRWNGQQKSC